MVWITWFLSAISIISLWLVGNKNVWGFVIGLVGQGFWLLYTMSTEQYGLIPGVLVYTVVYIRNIYQWRQDG